MVTVMTDPIGDMLTHIRNATTAGKLEVSMPSSKLKEELAKLFVSEGFADGFGVEADGPKRTLRLSLRYAGDRQPVLQGLKRVSKPGRRVYRPASDLPRSQGGMGVNIISTSQGLLPDREARRRRLGGEVLCEVW